MACDSSICIDAGASTVACRRIPTFKAVRSSAVPNTNHHLFVVNLQFALLCT